MIKEEEIEKMFLDWWKKSPKDIAYASTMNIAAVGFAAGVKAAQQSAHAEPTMCSCGARGHQPHKRWCPKNNSTT